MSGSEVIQHQDVVYEVVPKKDEASAVIQQIPLPLHPHTEIGQLSVLERKSSPQSRSMNEFCSRCQNIINHWPSHESRDWLFSHYNTRLEFEKSAEMGCSMCAQLLHSPIHYTNANLRCFDDYELRNDDTLDLLGGFVVLTHVGDTPRAGYNTWNVVLSIPASENSYKGSPIDGSSAIPETRSLLDRERETIYWSWTVQAYDTKEWCCGNVEEPDSSGYEGEPNTKEGLPLVSEWLNICREQHIKCRNRLSSNRLPTRLLYLAGGKPRLCITATLKIRVDYATLSHCWGSLRPITLVKASLKSFLEELPPEALPKTFREAIQISQAVGLSYLWIDSLCIIQDDNEDWKFESGQMTTVYGNSSLNIAASGAKHGEDGCFFPRDPSWQCKITVRDGAANVVHQVCPREMVQQGLQRMPLISRGWAVQERILPRRTVHFTCTQVFWECDELQACEMFPKSLPCLPDPWELRPEWPIGVEAWNGILEWYCLCGLTRSQDKLVALSGLAKLIFEGAGQTYVAGLWKTNLEHQLCWKVQCARVGYVASRPLEYRAPTWSWASLDDDHILFRNSTVEKRIMAVQMHEVEVQPRYPGSPFGEISNARLRLKCSHFYGGILVENFVREDQLIEINGVPVNLLLLFDESEIICNKFPVQICLLLVETASLTFARSADQHGLILAVTGHGQGQYMRIGYFTRKVQLDRSYTGLLPNDEEQFNESDYSEVFADAEGKTHRIIDIV